MTTSMTLRELANNPKLLDQYSTIDLIDKRKKQRRGMYLSELEAKQYREFKARKKQESGEKKGFLENMSPFIGSLDGKIGNLTKEEERAIRYKKHL